MTDQLLTENEVVEALKTALVDRGWKIVSFATTAQTGIDVHAEREGQMLLIEAKGTTSSKEGSARYGKPPLDQQFIHHGEAALFKCAELRGLHPSALIAMAFPDHQTMRRRLAKTEPFLEASAIAVFWVGADGEVSAWNAPWFH